MTCELAVEHRLHERSEPQSIIGADEVDRRPHEGDPHDLPVLEQLSQLLRAKADEPRPQRRVGVERNLRLQPYELLDRVERRQGRTAQQQLPRESRAIERAVAQDIPAHELRPCYGDRLPCSGLERCPSGLRSATGNRVRAERCVAGSNPALSVRGQAEA
jgi:hypothetical protein